MLKKVVVSILIITFAVLPLTGCWDRKEMSELAIVMAVGFDKDIQTGNIILTTQVMRPSSLKSQQSGNNMAPYEIIISSGNTIFEAVRNADREFDRRCYFSHLKVVVVGETLAREGLDDIIDFISRTNEIRTYTSLVVAQGEEASKMLGLKHGIEDAQANYMEGIIKAESTNSDVTSVELIDFMQKMSGEGINPVTGAFKIQNVKSVSAEGNKLESRQGIVLTGTAAFSKGKLVGFLNNDETRGFKYLIGTMKSGAVHVPSIKDKSKNISIQIKKVDRKIEPIMINGKITFKIEVKAEGDVTEIGDGTDVRDPEQFNEINSKFKESVQNDIRKAVIKTQNDLKTDILGFGSAFEEKYPGEWKKLKEQWNTQFCTVSYDIKVETSLKKTGLMLDPIRE